MRAIYFDNHHQATVLGFPLHFFDPQILENIIALKIPFSTETLLPN